jgi:hypothetical protein
MSTVIIGKNQPKLFSWDDILKMVTTLRHKLRIPLNFPIQLTIGNCGPRVFGVCKPKYVAGKLVSCLVKVNPAQIVNTKFPNFGVSNCFQLFIATIAHELKHVLQFICGDLRIRNNKILWSGKNYNTGFPIPDYEVEAIKASDKWTPMLSEQFMV